MRSILIAIFIIAGGSYVHACDLCGCSAGNQYLGILPQFHKQFIGLQYQYTGFTADQRSFMDPEERERAHVFNNTIQLWGRYYVSDRVQLFGFVPYHSNSGNDVGEYFKVSGLGDISVIANAVVIKDRNDSGFSSWHHTLLAGGGVKAPTGKYTGITTLDEEGLPNIQAGTGSWDIIANANYTVRYGKTGLNADAAYTITTAGKAGYKYGNRLNSGLMAFYWLQKNSFSLLPQAGGRYENSLHDYDNYARKWLNEGSGGTVLFGTVGLQAYYKRYGAKVMYSIPVSQHYADNNVTVMPRLETNIFLLF